MEENRLKPMNDYDPKLFNRLYQKTRRLTATLAYGINPKIFGVDRQEIISWFDVKFIYVFNKYCDRPEGELLGRLINSLTMYKFRLLRKSYTKKYKLEGSIDLAEDIQNYDRPDDDTEDNSSLVGEAMKFMKANLSEDAYLVLQIDLQPPAFILEKMKEAGLHNLSNIPPNLIADYLGLGEDEYAIQYVKQLKREIKDCSNSARTYFLNQGLS